MTSEEQLFRITDAAIQFFDDNANPGERFRMTLERVGLDKFEEKIKEEGQQVLKLIDNEDGTYDLIVKKLEE